MPTLNITKTYADGSTLTEAMLDNIRDGIHTFINTTGLDNDNIQNGGLGSQKLALTSTSKTGAYTATATDHIIFCDASGGDFAVTLFAASSNTGRFLTIVNNGSSGIVTVDGNSSETIDGKTTRKLRKQYDHITIFCDGSNWQIIDDNRRPLVEQGFWHTRGGYGSTATKIPYFSTEVTDTTGTLITVDHSSTSTGFVATAQGTCKVDMHFSFVGNSGDQVGISLNSTQLTTNAGSITTADLVAYTGDIAANNTGMTYNYSGYLANGDDLRPHCNGSTASTAYRVTITAIGEQKDFD